MNARILGVVIPTFYRCIATATEIPLNFFLELEITKEQTASIFPKTIKKSHQFSLN